MKIYAIITGASPTEKTYESAKYARFPEGEQPEGAVLKAEFDKEWTVKATPLTEKQMIEQATSNLVGLFKALPLERRKLFASKADDIQGSLLRGDIELAYNIFEEKIKDDPTSIKEEVQGFEAVLSPLLAFI